MLNEASKVLDHGYVKYVAHMGSEEGIIEAARMSTGKGFEGWEKDINLLSFLYRNKHMTPFEMCELAIEVSAPISVAREWMRSRTQSYNEFSARYSVMPDVHYLPPPERMVKQATANKQASGTELIDRHADVIHNMFKDEQKILYSTYQYALDQGLAKEVARLNTPVSRYTKFRAKANLRNWLQFLDLRLRKNAQLEIRVFADEVAKLINLLFPKVYALFLDHTLNAVTFSATEIAVLRANLSGHAITTGAMSKKEGEEFMAKLLQP